MTAPNRLERVIRDLERDPHLLRVKKLLYCACYGVWEDSRDRLNQVSLDDLVQGVWERSPTVDALQFQLNRVVKTLNKPVEYAQVANGILRVLSQLYRDTYDITRPVVRTVVRPLTPPPSVPVTQARYGRSLGQPRHSEPAPTQWLISDSGPSGSSAQRSSEVAMAAHVVQALASHPEQQRLKKLLICVCKNFWENDPARLAATDWHKLIQETQELIPTLDNLDYVLQAIVKSLSKPIEYLPVAQILLDLVAPVYAQHRLDETQFFGVDNAPMLPEETHWHPAIASEVNPTAIVAPEPPVTQVRYHPHSVGGNGTGHSTDGTAQDSHALGGGAEDEKRTGPFAWALPDSPLDNSNAASPEGSPERPSQEPPAVASIDTGESEAFALRLALMRYANPLMAKIVAFSALYRLFRFSEQDWAELRRHDLATLLMALHQRYPNFTDLEVNLCAIAEQLEPSDKALQTAAALLKVLRPHYAKAGTAPARVLTAQTDSVRATQAESTDSLEADLARLTEALGHALDGAIDSIESDDLPLPFQS